MLKNTSASLRAPACVAQPMMMKSTDSQNVSIFIEKINMFWVRVEGMNMEKGRAMTEDLLEQDAFVWREAAA